MSAKDPRKPLLGKLLAVPALRNRYLRYVRQITEEWLDWKNVQPLVAQYRGLIDAEVKSDTRKLMPYEAFVAGLGLESAATRAASEPAELRGAAVRVPAGPPGGEEGSSTVMLVGRGGGRTRLLELCC